MFSHDHFYHGLIRKYIIYFGSLFDEIYIERTEPETNQTQLMKVPLTFSKKDKILVRVDADPTITRPFAITLPRMGFEFTGLRYDADRHLNKTNFIVAKDNNDPNKLKRMWQSVPYTIDWNLYIMVKNAEDGTKIIEQILPFFTPSWTATLNLIPEMGIKVDVPLDFNGITVEDTYDSDYTTRRAMIYTLTFSMQAYFYGPVVPKPIIKFSKQRFFVPNTNGDIANNVGNIDSIGEITVTPGLLANGAPTTDSSLSVSPNIIEIDDDFGFCIDNTGIIINE